jgi:hypothetical protein
MTSRECVPRMMAVLGLIKMSSSEEVVSHRRQRRPSGVPHGAAQLFLVGQPVCDIADNRAAIATQALAEAGHTMPAARAISLEAHVAPSHEDAVEVARPFLEARYAGRGVTGRGKVPHRLRHKSRYLTRTRVSLDKESRQSLTCLTCRWPVVFPDRQRYGRH